MAYQVYPIADANMEMLGDLLGEFSYHADAKSFAQDQAGHYIYGTAIVDTDTRVVRLHDQSTDRRYFAAQIIPMKKPDPIDLDRETQEYLRRIMKRLGQKGGKAKSAKKAESSRKNLGKGRAKRKPKTEER